MSAAAASATAEQAGSVASRFMLIGPTAKYPKASFRTREDEQMQQQAAQTMLAGGLCCPQIAGLPLATLLGETTCC